MTARAGAATGGVEGPSQSHCGPRDGTVTFLPGQETESRIVDGPTPGAVTLPMEDVLPAFEGEDLSRQELFAQLRINKVSNLAQVRRGVERALLVADMPYGSFHTGPNDTVRAAGAWVSGATYINGTEVLPAPSRMPTNQVSPLFCGLFSSTLNVPSAATNAVPSTLPLASVTVTVVPARPMPFS